MKQRCIHCGQISDVEDPEAQRFTCPACGKNSWISERTGVANGGQSAGASRFRLRDFAIGVLAALVLGVLAFLFFRRDQPLHRMVFGELRGPAASSPTPSHDTATQPRGGGSASGTPVSASAGGSPAVTTVPLDQTAAVSGDGGAGSSGAGSVGSGAVGTGTAGTSTAGNPASGGGVIINPATGTPVASSSGGAGQPAGSAYGSGGFGANGSANTGGRSGTIPPNSGVPSGGAADVGQGLAQNTGQHSSSAPTAPLQGSSATSVAPAANQPATADSANSRPPGAASAGNSGASPVTGASPAPASQTTASRAAASSPTSDATRSFPRSAPASPSASAPLAQTATPTTPGNPSSASSSQTKVANEGQNELLQLAKKDDSTSPDSGKPGEDTSKKAGPGAVPTPAQVAALANPDAKTPTENSSTAAAGGLAGKTPDDNQPKPQPNRPFDPQGGSNVVFVLDHSLSMKGERSDMARHELVQTLEKLRADTLFYVFFFPEKAMPAPGPLPATPENVQAMTKWIYSVGHSLGSDPTKAMLKALDFRPDTLLLLSDGRFSSEVPETIRLANEQIHARIHTVGFCNCEDERLLKKIAQENNGTYRFVGAHATLPAEPTPTTSEGSPPQPSTQP